MKSSSRAKLENFDPNASDPNDSDFEENPSSPPRRSSKKKKSASARKKNQKRSRRNYSDDDILDDDDDISEESYGSPSAESEDEPEINENTGRPTRRATKKEIKYEESEGEEDIEDDELVVDSLEKHTGDKRKQQRSLIVKLRPPTQRTAARGSQKRRADDSSDDFDPDANKHESTPSRREPLGELDSDSSDDDDVNQSGQRGPHAPGAAVTPKSTAGSLVPLGSGASSAQKDFRGGPANFGKIGGTSNADVSPVTVDENVNFDSVGGLDNHINQLKEMVSLPLLYPEVFEKFKITPPRGVLFHGPPGTGKTLLARALSNAVSANGKKVTFYMRKGADALSKWIGEAERQLRMLFEDARKNQPSIIFFDEIDGLAPVRSSKSEQSLASIVATLLALMDGMDDRGQVVIIGATNRPDNVDPALRRPGRFDREFYFPLPTVEARRAIIDIHTKNWSPPLANAFKDQLADLTKGYGGADLRALCTEAAVNAVQGTFPQIYQSNKKLVIDTDKIKVSAKDFMISVNKIVPSSQRSSSFGAAPLPKSTTPLLKPQLEEIIRIIDEVIPPKQKLTALEEAQYDDRDDEFGFERENIKRDFDQVRVFRPRLLVRGYEGMGQQEIGAALLHKFENTHVQSFDLPSLLGDKDKTAEATLVQLFKEVRTHKPSVIYIPQVDVWYATVGEKVISIFISLLRTMPANEPVLILGTMEQHDDDDKPDPTMLKDLFGFSLKNQYELTRPNETAREEFFENVVAYIRKAPKEYPEANRKKRKFEVLQEAPEDQSVLAKPPSKAELRTIKQRDRHTLNQLKLALGPVMEQLKQKYKKFRTGIIAQSQIQYLMDEENPQVLTSDVPLEQRPGEFRPFELARDRKGVTGLRETATGKFYYNMSLEMIEERLAHGYYKRPIDYFEDCKTLVKDAVTSGDMDRIVKANEIFANVEVDVTHLRDVRPELVDACEGVYKREQERLKALEEEVRKQGTQNGHEVVGIRANVPPADGQSHIASDNTGPIVLDADDTGVKHMPPITPTHPIRPSPLSNGVSASDNTDNNHRHSNGSAGFGDDSAHLDDSQDPDSQHRDKRQKLAEDTQQSAPNTQTYNRSQRSGHTQMAPNTQPGDYQNSASTTTSGQKTSDHSSVPYSNTQSTIHGVAPGQHPDFASGPAQSGGSQIPDTQEPFASSQPSNSQQSQSSQSHFAAPLMPPARQEPKIGSLLNSNEQQPEPHLILDDGELSQFHTELVRRSSGLSVEQLEQVNSSMMAAIWKERGDWNRIRVMHSALAAFNATIRDIEEMQKVWPPSQEKQNKQ
ncbi:ATPase AAA+ type core [Neofusicoccum parvum]|nr:ATPase AAA+ type core [Neofusicoccum parvum]